MSVSLSPYNSGIHESILIIFGKNVTEEVDNKRYFIFPPHRTSASALPGKTGNPEIVFFHLNAAWFFTKNTKHIKNITWAQLNHPSLSKRSTVCTRQDQEGSIASCCLLPSSVMFTNSITVSVAVSKWELLLSSIGAKVNGQYCWDILLSQQILVAIVVSFTTILSFSKAVHQCILHSTQSNCCSAKLSTSFLPSYGPVTVQSLTPLTIWDLESHIAAWACVASNNTE